MVDMTSKALLQNIIHNGMHQQLDAEEMAAYVVESGFVHVVTGHVAADIIEWTAREVQAVLHSAEMADSIALPEETTGVAEAIAEGESLRETPDAWLFDLAERVRRGEA